jgi:predicted transcriptional regulator/transcriptional regulator with XRE-family HTH domain
MNVLRLGAKIRRLRREQKLSQAQMAAELGMSASYLNLLEHNQRPVTVPVLLKLAQRFAIDLESLTGNDEAQLLSALTEAFADPLFQPYDVTPAELRELIDLSPGLGQAVLSLYQAYCHSSPPGFSTDDPLSLTPTPGLTGMPSEEVSDFLQQKNNYFPALEAAAERFWSDHGLTLAGLQQDLEQVLATRFAVDVVIQPTAAMGSLLREYRPMTRQLYLSELLSAGTRLFQIAHRIALLGYRKEIDLIVAGGKFTSDEAVALGRNALANYFASAIMMPYDLFYGSAEATRYNLSVLESRFGASFEQVCHRLTTLQRAGATGIPFHMIRVDSAGNISKRFSASGIAIARYGAACPRWNIFDANATPGMLRLQVSQMPDGTKYFCLARTVPPIAKQTSNAMFGPRVSRLSIGLGCRLSEAKRIIYADGVALDQPEIVTLIGISCRICDRPDCHDRATPSFLSKLNVDADRKGLSAYSVINDEGKPKGWIR